jgi:hypothetical protein
LRANLAGRGSPLYKLTWKHWDIRPQQRICALRASALRTSASVSTGVPSGWGTPNASAFGGTPEAALERKKGHACGQSVTVLDYQAQLTGWPTAKQDHGIKSVRSPEGATKESERKGANDLNTAAVLAGWPTPTKGNGDGSQSMSTMSSTGKRANGTKGTVSLPGIAVLAGYPTPAARDWRDGRSNQHGKNARPLNEVALLTGTMLSTSRVQTAKRGQLNGSLSRWLMGFPKVWCEAAIEAWHRTPTTRRKRG